MRPDTPPIIRDATPADAAAIAAIYSESVARGDATMDEEPWTTAQVEAQMAAQDAREGFLVLEQDGAVLGWGVFKRYSPRAGYRFAGETATYLRRDQTGRGHGTRLKRALIARCRDAGYHHLVARVAADNAASIAYNLRLGYEVVGVQRQIGYRDGRWLDVTILQLLL
jgi:L-amino acid N-acyltransferase YncA